MAGIYVHVPFCRKACIYCDFHFSTALAAKSDMVAAIVKEIALRRTYLDDEVLNSLYFGGGTPSLLDQVELEQIMEAVHKNFRFAEGAEITLEANPDDLNRDKLDTLKKAGVNRLSIGVQSFREADLAFMNRTHKAGEAITAIKQAQDTGLDNISIDLIYASPGLTDMDWLANMEQAIALEVPHISAYSLTVEEKTVLAHKIRKGEVQAVADETAQRHFLMLERLHEAGFEHYEVSNLARKGREAVHNSNYWSGKTYLGIGPSAHSFNGNSRQWNVAKNAFYIKALRQGIPCWEKEDLSLKDQYNEWVMTQMRKKKGVFLEELETRFGKSMKAYFLKEAASEIGKGNVLLEEGLVHIPQDRRFYTDGVAASLFYL